MSHEIVVENNEGQMTKTQSFRDLSSHKQIRHSPSSLFKDSGIIERNCACAVATRVCKQTDEKELSFFITKLH
jgi:hypothetical protein